MEKQDYKKFSMPVIKWVWVIPNKFGGDYMNKINYYDIEYNKYDWSNFLDSWLVKLENIKTKAEHYNLQNEIEDWVKYIENNINKHEKTFNQSLNLLRVSTKKLFTKIIDSYDREFDLLINYSTELDDFIDVLDFLNELPWDLIHYMDELKKQELDNIPKYTEPQRIPEKITYNQKEKPYIMAKELDKTDSFLI